MDRREVPLARIPSSTGGRTAKGETSNQAGEETMTRVYSSLNAALTHNLRNVLESCNIACEVRGEYRRVAMGEVPITESWVELWVVDDDRVGEAQTIIAQGEAQHGARSWRCHACGEIIEGQFDQCWHCGAVRG